MRSLPMYTEYLSLRLVFQSLPPRKLGVSCSIIAISDRKPSSHYLFTYHITTTGILLLAPMQPMLPDTKNTVSASAQNSPGPSKDSRAATEREPLARTLQSRSLLQPYSNTQNYQISGLFGSRIDRTADRTLFH